MATKKEKTVKYYKNRKCICIQCGTKENVQKTTNFYNAEIKGDYTLHFICDNCNKNNADDI